MKTLFNFTVAAIVLLGSASLASAQVYDNQRVQEMHAPNAAGW